VRWFKIAPAGQLFHLTADRPVVTYQMNPYGGGTAATTARSLLLRLSVSGHHYVGATAGVQEILGGG